MDPTLASLTLSDVVWVICERHRIAQRGTVVTVTADAVTVKLPRSKLPPQRYDRGTGMRILDAGPQRSNDFFIRTSLPARFYNKSARPPYVVVGGEPENAHATA